ncbi:hypothetical protein H7T43_20670, partial [Peribacillus simplex]|uniref:hypothetical protein n=1 Tax=Peribacillus simplex TaxID=1478 RepID=UPI002989E824
MKKLSSFVSECKDFLLTTNDHGTCGINIKWLLVFGTGAKLIIMANKTNRGYVVLKNGDILKDVAISVCRQKGFG